MARDLRGNKDMHSLSEATMAHSVECDCVLQVGSTTSDVESALLGF
jgi:hypothetical protein